MANNDNQGPFTNDPQQSGQTNSEDMDMDIDTQRSSETGLEDNLE